MQIKKWLKGLENSTFRTNNNFCLILKINTLLLKCNIKFRHTMKTQTQNLPLFDCPGKQKETGF